MNYFYIGGAWYTKSVLGVAGANWKHYFHSKVPNEDSITVVEWKALEYAIQEYMRVNWSNESKYILIWIYSSAGLSWVRVPIDLKHALLI